MPIPFEITLSPGQVALLEEFRRAEGLPSQAAALALLLDIALETVTGPGDRFWDRAPTPGNEPPRR